MRSDKPKVLHQLAGKPLLAYVLDTARVLCPSKLIVVVGHGADMIRAAFPEPDIHFVVQTSQLGTGHAVLQAVPELDDAHPTLILYGDVPLTQTQTLRTLVSAAGDSRFGILTAKLDNPDGYGRIVRQQGKVVRVVEQKDANLNEREITEVNTGIVVCPTLQLKTWLSRLSNKNAQGEYYLTDLVSCAVADNMRVISSEPERSWEILGVNSKIQLAELERLLQSFHARKLLNEGITLIDPLRIDIRGVLDCGQDVVIDIGCIFEGHVSLEDGVHIGPYCTIRNSHIAKAAQIFAYSHLDGVKVGANAHIGPYARLRPGTELAEQTHIGNFVEVKNSYLGSGTKANHLAYIGDATVGQEVNIGAGTITCNYDGVNKHRTIIEDNAFIGSDTQLVAPVTVGKGATIGAGTTLTKNAPADKLTLSRVKQTSLDNWSRPKPKK